MSRILDTVLPSFAFYVGFLEEGDTLGLMDIAGLFLGGFSEVSGLDLKMSFDTLQEGGVNDRLHRLPGRMDFSNITLTKGVSFTDDLWNWQEGWLKGEGVRKSVFILLANSMQIPLKIWVAERAMPISYTGPTLNASSSGVAIEKLELVHDKLSLLFSTGDIIDAASGAVASAF
jgi:phage tail-like protein